MKKSLLVVGALTGFVVLYSTVAKLGGLDFLHRATVGVGSTISGGAWSFGEAVVVAVKGNMPAPGPSAEERKVEDIALIALKLLEVQQGLARGQQATPQAAPQALPQAVPQVSYQAAP